MIARTLASAAARTGSAMATAAAPASRSFASGSGTPGFTIALCQIMVGDVRTRCSSPAGCCVRSYCHDGSLWICTMSRTSPPTLPPHGKRSPQLLVKPTAPKWLCCLSALTRLTQPGGEAHARLGRLRGNACGFDKLRRSSFPKYAEEVPASSADIDADAHPSTAMLSQAAKENSVWLVGGTALLCCIVAALLAARAHWAPMIARLYPRALWGPHLQHLRGCESQGRASHEAQEGPLV